MYGQQRPRRAGVVPEPQPLAILTREGEQALRAELDRLRRRLDVEFVSRLRDARAFGDIAGNDEYLQIKEEEAVLAARIARLERLLSTATVLDEADFPSGVAAIGSVVVVTDLDSGEMEELRLIGGHERLTAGAISVNSPVGRALAGQTVGDEVELTLPRSRTRRLRVAGVRSVRPRTGFTEPRSLPRIAP